MAKDVITRFKLETTGFDSKIKQAAKDLSNYSKTATQAKEGFNQFTKANIDAAKEAARYGISAERAVNYCLDSQGTAAVYVYF